MSSRYFVMHNPADMCIVLGMLLKGTCVVAGQ